MHILVDIGNTNILFGKFDNLNLVEQLRIETKVFDKDISKIDSETYAKIHNLIGNDCSSRYDFNTNKFYEKFSRFKYSRN